MTTEVPPLPLGFFSIRLYITNAKRQEAKVVPLLGG